MPKRLKITILRLARFMGLFHLTRRWVDDKLLVLCYHGFSMRDEHQFRPQLFMTPALFKERLEWLTAANFNILELGSALSLLEQGILPRNSVCLTIDDGFFSVGELAAPILKQYGVPATLYVTSYYVKNQRPILRLVVQYMFWRTRTRVADFSALEFLNRGEVNLQDGAVCELLIWEIIHHCEKLAAKEEEIRICERLAAILQVDYREVVDSRSLSLVSQEELAHLGEAGIDVQLHTHRHHFPEDNRVRALAEIEQNRSYLASSIGHSPEHFCYPSGEWQAHQWPWLREAGVSSATTCQPGFNSASTPRLALYRLLDQDDLTEIEFEAEVSGFMEFLRVLLGARRRMERQRAESRH